MLGIGWAFTVSDFLSEKSKENYQEQLIADADNYFKEGLYQRAINNYKEYLNNNQSEEICKKLINAYDKRLEEDDRITSDYISSMESITAAYEKNEAFVDKLADLYRKSKKYEKEYQCLSKAIKNGIDSANIKKRINEVRYMNKISPLAYSDVKGPSNGEYVVTYNEYMITFSEAGKSSRSLYEYMSLANNNGDRMEYKITTKDEMETIELAQNFESEKFPNMIICLNGELGSGKTVFTKGLADALGIKDTITSPTFAIIKEYDGELPLYHMDVYRLDGNTEGVGIEEYFTKGGVVVIEWADTIKDILPEERLDIKFKVLDENRRILHLYPHGKKYEELCEAVI